MKDLKVACAQYGATAPFTVSILESLCDQAITPNDWRTLARACLSGGDYLLWKSEFQEHAREQARRNHRLGQNPQQNWGFEMLLGEGIFTGTDVQVRYPAEVYIQINSCVLKAWKKLPSGKRTEELSKIVQGPDERYQDFVSRLLQAVGRAVADGEAGTLLVKQLAFENANTACQTILRPYYRKGTLEDYVCLCTDVVSSYLQGVVLAAALKETTIEGIVRQTNGQGMTCFGCGQKGHMKKDCRKKGQSNNNGNNKKSPGLCPKCNRGKHWANECRSKTDKDGNPMQGNFKRGQAPARQTIGAVSMLQQGRQPLTDQEIIQMNQRSGSKTYDGPLKEAQDWI